MAKLTDYETLTSPDAYRLAGDGPHDGLAVSGVDYFTSPVVVQVTVRDAADAQACDGDRHRVKTTRLRSSHGWGVVIQCLSVAGGLRAVTRGRMEADDAQPSDWEGSAGFSPDGR